MDIIIGLIIMVVVIMLVGGVFRTNSEVEYLIVVQPARRGLGCLPFIAAILIGMFVVALFYLAQGS